MEQNLEHIRKGDVVYVLFPFDNQVQVKERPALILFKSDLDSFVCCYITKSPHREHKIQLNGTDLDSGKIDYEPSFIRPNIINTIKGDLIRRKIGTLKPEKLAEVINRVKELLDQDPEDGPVSKAVERPRKRIR